jgi:hypothetical protein
VDLSKLDTPDKIIGGSGIALLIFSFFPWFGVEGYGGGGNAWDVGFFTGILPTLLGLVAVAWIIATKLADVDLPEIPLPEGLLLLIISGAAAALIILRLLIGYEVGGFGVTFDLDRKIGLYLATLSAIGLVVGSFLKFQADGGELPGKGGSSGSSGPTPF